MYQELAEIPTPASAEFLEPNVIRLNSHVRDHVANANRSMSKLLVVTDTSVTATKYEEVDQSHCIASLLAPSKTRRALLIETKEGSTSRRRVEVWCEAKMEAVMDVTDRHDAFYADDLIGSLAFSASETSLIYTAEAKVPEDTKDPYARFRYTPSLGEGFPGKKRPTLFLFCWIPAQEDATSTKRTALMSLTFDSPVLLGQAVFSPDNKAYATGFEYLPDKRFLGLIWCTNRPSGIWEIALPPLGDLVTSTSETLHCPIKKLTPSHLSCRSPRIVSHLSSASLFWMSCESGGPHAATSSIYKLDISSSAQGSSPQAILDTVFEKGSDGFAGFYPCASNLPRLPFVYTDPSQPPYIVSCSAKGSRSTVLLISTSGGGVQDLTPDTDGTLFSWTVLATDGHRQLLCARSSISIPPEVVLGALDGAGRVSWRVVETPTLTPRVEKALSTLRTSIIPIPGRYPTEAIVIQKEGSDKNQPCITSPHGGPHGSVSTAFSPVAAVYALDGYTISLPNYTGSTGFGENNVRALIGKGGTLDVGDCIATVRHLSSIGVSSMGPGKQLLSGGSYGGFLIGHLIGQYPDMFSAAVLRNPVISCGDISNSDIPDWHYAEFGVPYPLSSSPSQILGSDITEGSARDIPRMTPEIYEKLYVASPIAHVDKVKTPVLLVIGAADQRVSPTQGIGYYHALKRNQDRKVEMLVFEGEGHALGGVETARVAWEAESGFFAECIGKPKDVVN